MVSNLVLRLFFVLAVCITALLAEDRAIYLVMMEDEPVAFHRTAEAPEAKQREAATEAYKQVLLDSHEKTLQSNLEAGSYDKLYSFHHAVNGFAIHTTPSQAERLRHAEGVALIEKDPGVSTLTTYTPDFLDLPSGPWAQAGGPQGAGEGIVIGFVDTGIDPAHPSFAFEPPPLLSGNGSTGGSPTTMRARFTGGACDIGPSFPLGSCNGKIVSARHFWAGASRVLPIGPPEGLSPFDEVGHGTHVASVAAGNYRVPVVVKGFNYGYASGMAPRARIAVYKAIYLQGGTLVDVVAAIDQAVLDGVDVLTLSIGPNQTPQDIPVFLNIFELAILSARRAGIFVAQAAGNRGPTPSSIVTYSPWSVAVAASTTNRGYNPYLILGNGTRIRGVALSKPTFGNGILQFPLIAARDAAAHGFGAPSSLDAEECQRPQALLGNDVRGAVVICNFSAGFASGLSTVYAVQDTARVLGFAGFVLVANPSLGDFLAQPLPFDVPGIMVPSVADARVLMEYYENQTQRSAGRIVVAYRGRGAITEGRTAEFMDVPPAVARFSSRGPDVVDVFLNPADVLKPDVLAPGAQIWGAWSPASGRDPVYKGSNFALLSGTSMATPHVAGVAALIRQLRPQWDPSTIASALSTTASKHGMNGQPIPSQGFLPNTTYPSTPFDYGAGLIDPSKALSPGLVFPAGFDDYVAFLCSIPNIDRDRVKRSVGGPGCTNLTSPLSSPADLNLPSITLSSLTGTRLIRRMAISVAMANETYVASVVPPQGVQVTVTPAWFTVPPQGTQELQIMLSVTPSLQAVRGFVFGEIVLTGSLDHIVRLPLSVIPMVVS